MEKDTDIDQFGLHDFSLMADNNHQDQLILQPGLHDDLSTNPHSTGGLSIDGAGSSSFHNNNNNNNLNNHNNQNIIPNNQNNTTNTATTDDFEGILFGLNQFGLPSNTFNPGENNIIFKPNNTLTNLESPEQIIISNANNDYDNNNNNSSNTNFNQYLNSNDMIDIDSPNVTSPNKGINRSTVFNMPGAFRTSTTDYMDLDDSPQFTIESDSNTYYDQNLRPSIIDIQDTESLFKNVNNNNNNNNTAPTNNSRNNLNNNGSVLLTVPTTTNNISNKTPPASKGETSSISPFDNSSRVSSGHNVNQFPNGNAMFMNNNAVALTAFPTTTTHVNPSTTLNANSESIIFDEIHQEINRIRKDSIDSYYSNNLIHTPNNNTSSSAGVNITLPSQQFNNLTVHNPNNPNNNKFLNDLSPLTTTTSLTPSVNSVHSTQPSFFSAHQYLSRNSLEQPPSGNPHRPSFDLYNNKLVENHSPSAVSTNSRRNPSSGTRYSSFTNSISNILPFMSDKNNNSSQRSPPMELPVSPSNPLITSPQPGSRHLIRSIFKSSATKTNVTNGLNPFGNNNMINGTSNINGTNNNNNNNNNNGNLEFLESDAFMDTTINSSNDNNNDYLMMSPTKEEDFENINGLDIKKAKRSKMNLFTRFKTTPSKQQEQFQQQLQQQAQLQNIQIDDFEAKLLMEERQSLENGITLNNISVEASTLSSRTPSTATNNQNGLEYTSSNNSHQQVPSQSQSLSQSQTFLPTQEPDYAALFENVGKRKAKSTKKVKVKSEEEKSNLLSLNLGGSSSTKSKVKSEQDGSNPSTEKSSIFNIKLNSNNSTKATDVASVSSSNGSASLHAQYSQNSEHSNRNDSEQTPNSSSGIAGASKRILGSKLMMKRKNSGNIKVEDEEIPIKEEQDEDDISSITTTNSNPIVATMIQKGVEVEVDLKSLDLPANTQIFPTSIINSKNRTRGRKENKEADINDQAKIYLCNYCSRRFKRQEHLKRHFRSLHTFEKPYVCDICHKKFSRSDNLNQHLKIHKLEEEGGLGVDGEEGVKLEEDVEMS